MKVEKSITKLRSYQFPQYQLIQNLQRFIFINLQTLQISKFAKKGCYYFSREKNPKTMINNQKTLEEKGSPTQHSTQNQLYNLQKQDIIKTEQIIDASINFVGELNTINIIKQESISLQNQNINAIGASEDNFQKFLSEKNRNEIVYEVQSMKEQQKKIQDVSQIKFLKDNQSSGKASIKKLLQLLEIGTNSQSQIQCKNIPFRKCIKKINVQIKNMQAKTSQNFISQVDLFLKLEEQLQAISQPFCVHCQKYITRIKTRLSFLKQDLEQELGSKFNIKTELESFQQNLVQCQRKIFESKCPNSCQWKSFVYDQSNQPDQQTENARSFQSYTQSNSIQANNNPKSILQQQKDKEQQELKNSKKKQKSI